MANNKIEKLLEEAAIKKASDLHLKVGQPPILRIDGVLKPIEKEVSLTSKDVLDLICSITEKHQQDKYIKNKELDFSYEIKDIARYRINAHWESGNPSLVARVIGIDVPTMEEIMMPEVVYDLMNSKQGLILVTGPTGSGKSTSLAAMIDYVNKNRNLHIVTLEDPVEFVYQQNKSLIR
ncbi:MAG: ATPase, T2SS/T4P/T4SS family, partial [Patescibacteria group bacterium]